jgi:hypothetical protein
MTEEKDELITSSPEADRQAAKMAKKRAEYGRQLAKEGTVPFNLDGTSDELEERAHSLANSKDVNDAELSFLLYTLREKRGFIDKSYETFAAYVEAEIGIGKSKANEMATTWEAFMMIGLPTTVLGGEHPMSWNKFRLVRPLIKVGYLTEASIYEWLPWLTTDGPEALRMSDLETRVKRILGSVKPEDEAAVEGFTKIKIGIPNDRLDAFYNYQDVVRTGLNIDDAGMQCLKALEVLSSTIIGENYEAAKLGGLVGLKKAAEHLVPGVTVIFVTNNPELTFDKLGVPPVHSVYQGFSELGGKKELTFVLAASESEAKRTLQTDSVREFPIMLTPSIASVEVHPEKVPEPEPATESTGEVMKRPDFDLIPSDTKVKLLSELAKALEVAKIINKDALKNRVTAARAETKNEKQAASIVGNWLWDLCEEHNISITS